MLDNEAWVGGHSCILVAIGHFVTVDFVHMDTPCKMRTRVDSCHLNRTPMMRIPLEAWGSE